MNCLECNGSVKSSNEKITTIDPSDNYTMKTAGIYICEDCGYKIYVREALESDSE